MTAKLPHRLLSRLRTGATLKTPRSVRRTAGVATVDVHATTDGRAHYVSRTPLGVIHGIAMGKAAILVRASVIFRLSVAVVLPVVRVFCALFLAKYLCCVSYVFCVYILYI